MLVSLCFTLIYTQDICLNKVGECCSFLGVLENVLMLHVQHHVEYLEYTYWFVL